MADEAAPQFDLPFRLGPDGRDIATTPQDEIENVANSVQALRRTPLGFFEENPDYGVTDQTFEEGSLGSSEFESAISQWEPRADVLIEENPDLYDYLVRQINVEVSARSDA
jgi:phage baseplate assembly protein W